MDRLLLKLLGSVFIPKRTSYTCLGKSKPHGKIQASNIEAQTGLLVTGPSVFNMRADITDLNINGSNCNVYTKAEVDAKVAGGVGLLVKGNDTDGNVENINAEINATPDGYAKMFKTNYNGSYQMQTVLSVKLDTSRTFSLMFPKDSNLFRFQTITNGAWHTVVGTTSASQTITHEAPYVGMKLHTLENLMSTLWEIQCLPAVESASLT